MRDGPIQIFAVLRKLEGAGVESAVVHTAIMVCRQLPDVCRIYCTRGTAYTVWASFGGRALFSPMG